MPLRGQEHCLFVDNSQAVVYMSDQRDVFYIQSKLAIVEAFDQAVQTTSRSPHSFIEFRQMS